MNAQTEIENRIKELQLEKEATLNAYQTEPRLQDVLAERNTRLSLELNFLTRLFLASTQGTASPAKEPFWNDERVLDFAKWYRFSSSRVDLDMWRKSYLKNGGSNFPESLAYTGSVTASPPSDEQKSYAEGFAEWTRLHFSNTDCDGTPLPLNQWRETLGDRIYTTSELRQLYDKHLSTAG